MATDILMPKLGFSMTEAMIAEWHVANGSAVREGEPLYTIEADKSAQEVEAPATGTLTILVEPGCTVDVGTLLGSIA